MSESQKCDGSRQPSVIMRLSSYNRYVKKNGARNNLMVVLLGKCFTRASTGRYNTPLIFGWGFCGRTSFHRTLYFNRWSTYCGVCLWNYFTSGTCLSPRVENNSGNVTKAGIRWFVNGEKRVQYKDYIEHSVQLTFRHRASCILGEAFHYSPENAFYIFNQQIYFINWHLLDRASFI